MKPPSWHQKVIELARQRFEELQAPRESHPMLLFIRDGQIHCRTFFNDNADADDPSSAHCRIWKRIDDLKGTAGDAYAVASLTIWNGPSADQSWAISVKGAEREDPCETHWLQRISFDPESGRITCHECWSHDLGQTPNALSPV